MGAAHDALTNHGTVLKFQAILSRLDFIYSDKRPIHILESELSILRQGCILITKETNKIIRSNALRIFISKLNGSISETLFSLNPPDLPNALAKCQELESNNFRAQFANRYNGFRNENKNQGNNLRFASRQNNNNAPNRINNNWPLNENLGTNNNCNFNNNSKVQPPPEPMEVDSSIRVQNRPYKNYYRPRNNNSQWNFNNNRHNFNINFQGNNYSQYPIPSAKTEHNRKSGKPVRNTPPLKRKSTGTVKQPAQKTMRVNNISEGHFLDQHTTEECLI